MKLYYYNEIVEKYRQLNKRNCIDDLVSCFPNVRRETLESIVSQEYQRKTKKTYYQHASSHNVAKYYEKYLQESMTKWKECGILLKFADEVDLSPALMAKLILECHLKDMKFDDDCFNGKSKVKMKISDMLKDTSLIEHPYLAAEIKMCVLSDEIYGPISDAIKNAVGQEYEGKLKNELIQRGFAFIDEKQLREKGYDKTPDVKLDIPIAVDGNIVNWIESKASFGDEERHKEYLKEQYWSYCNRFGPGMVIYWAGYIEELNVNKDQGITIKDTFPDNVTIMDPTILMKECFIY